MKGDIKKLSVLVGVPVIALFIMVGMASANSAIPYGIKGVYAVTGFSSCGPGTTTAPPANLEPGTMEATYTFNVDGRVSLRGVSRSWAGPLPVMAVKADFRYTVTQGGRIEFQYPNDGLQVGVADDEGNFVGDPIMIMDLGPSHGVISPDGNMITISCGPPVKLTVVAGPVGMTMYCLTSLTGMRIH